jgi:hypothetical protein
MEKKTLPVKPQKRAKPSHLSWNNQNVLQPGSKKLPVKSNNQKSPPNPFDKDLDRMIFALYELTEEEIAIVENSYK